MGKEGSDARYVNCHDVCEKFSSEYEHSFHERYSTTSEENPHQKAISRTD